MPPPSFPISQQARLRKHVDRLATERAPTVKRHEAAPLGRERQIDGLVAKRIPGSLVPEPAPTGGQALPQGRATDAHRVTGGDVDLDNPQTPLCGGQRHGRSHQPRSKNTTFTDGEQ